MNVKFKMPKFGRNLTGKGFWKEIAMTTLATTISIILTFGTAHLIEQSQKKKAGRQTAMMVIHDIDQNVENLRVKAKAEEDYFEMTQHVVNNLDRIDAISPDTLLTVLGYILYTGTYQIDDSKEKIFHSSQDSWKNIDNASFIDLMQSFYHERRQYQELFNKDFRFLAPIPEEEQRRMMLEAPDFDIINNMSNVIKEKLRDKKVQLYLMYSRARSRTYNQVADLWKVKSERAKFIIGITDEELNEYVEKNKHSGRKVKERELLGHWTSRTSEDQVEELEFRDDHTFTNKVTVGIINPFYTGRLLSISSLTGTWKMEGDSLIMTFNKELHFELDRSKITYRPEMKDSVDSYIAHFEQMAHSMQQQEAQKKELRRKANAVYIDETGEKIEMTSTDQSSGVDQEINAYFFRSEKK